jgi:Domain of unknown function (DUF6259)/Concanavalin A-like lectin/glucanases superfamily
MKIGIKSLIIVFAASSALYVNAAEMVNYLFDQEIDENIKDRSGNNIIPSTTTDESSWVSSAGEDALQFKNKNDVVKIPFKAHPSSRGTLKLKVKFDVLNKGEHQCLWRVYGKKDGMSLSKHKNGSLRFSYYDRDKKKWYTAASSRTFLQPNRWYEVVATWDCDSGSKLYIDNKLHGKAQMNLTPDWDKKTVMLLGNDIRSSGPFKGMMRYFILTDTTGIPKVPAKAQAIKRSGKITAINLPGVKIGFDADDLSAVSCVDTKTKINLFSAAVRQPLWEIILTDKDDPAKQLKLNAFGKAQRSAKVAGGKMQLTWRNVEVPGEKMKFDVTATVAPGKKPGEAFWHISASKITGKWRYHTVTFPCLPLAMTNPEPQKNYLVWPYRWGRKTPDPFLASRKDLTSEKYSHGTHYPGSMHFQFTYLYGESKPGFYMQILDSVGHYKELHWDTYPAVKTRVQKLAMPPLRRGISDSFNQPYLVLTAVMNGDWYDAARKYRTWAIKQKWCGKGPLGSNKEVPQWYKNTVLAMKWSTSKPSRTIPNNRANTEWILKEFGRPAMGVWYHYTGNKESKDSSCLTLGWTGCAWNARLEAKPFPGVKAAIADMKKQQCYLIGYINSRLFDQSLKPNHADSIVARKHTMKNRDGSLQLYAKTMFDVCRYDKWWQDRIMKVCIEGVRDLGFSGMYLDSFGRGQYFCYDASHGHITGDSTMSISGMRKMGKRIKSEMRKYNPGAIISSEASIEQFVDIIDAKLLHYNIFSEACPIWQVIYHDYELTYGRYFFPKPTEDVICGRIRLASNFHIGAQLARFRPDGSRVGSMRSWKSEKGIKTAASLRSMSFLRAATLDYLALGEMLRPPEVANSKNIEVKTIKFTLNVPEVFSSAWRGPDGSVGMFFTNITGRDIASDYSFSATEYKVKGKKAQLIYVGADNKVVRKAATPGKISILSGATVGIIFK